MACLLSLLGNKQKEIKLDALLLYRKTIHFIVLNMLFRQARHQNQTPSMRQTTGADREALNPERIKLSFLKKFLFGSHLKGTLPAKELFSTITPRSESLGYKRNAISLERSFFPKLHDDDHDIGASTEGQQATFNNSLNSSKSTLRNFCSATHHESIISFPTPSSLRHLRDECYDKWLELQATNNDAVLDATLIREMYISVTNQRNSELQGSSDNYDSQRHNLPPIVENVKLKDSECKLKRSLSAQIQIEQLMNDLIAFQMEESR